MQLGSLQEIKDQEMNLEAAERAVIAAKLRLRALKGEPLLQAGDSVLVFELEEELKLLENEFGSRNLRMM